MESENLKRPLVLIVTTVIFGVLSFAAFVAPGVSSDPTGLAALLRKVTSLAAFIGALSGTLWGRKIVIGVFLLLLFSSGSGFYGAFQRFPEDAVGASIMASVATLPVLWFYWYTFGAASRRYYQEVRARSHDHSQEERRP